MAILYLDPHHPCSYYRPTIRQPRVGRGRVDERPHYAIAGTWAEFNAWRKEHPGLAVSYLTRARAEIMLSKGAPKGVVRRIGSWKSSAARQAAEQLED